MIRLSTNNTTEFIIPNFSKPIALPFFLPLTFILFQSAEQPVIVFHIGFAASARISCFATSTRQSMALHISLKLLTQILFVLCQWLSLSLFGSLSSNQISWMSLLAALSFSQVWPHWRIR